MTVLGLRIAPSRSLEKGVGQVVEGDGLREGKEIALLAVEKSLQGRVVRQQPVGYPVEAVEVQVLEIVVEQLPETAALLQPLVRRQLASGAHHAPNDDPDGGAQLAAIEAQLRQLDVQTQAARCLQGHVLGPDATRANDLHALEVHALVVARLGIGWHRGAASPHEACRVLLGQRLPGGVQPIDDEVELPVHQGLDALGQRPPLGPRHLELAHEVEHYVLAHRSARTHRLDKAVAVIGLARLPSFDRGAADEHAPTLDPGPGLRKR